MRRHASRFVSWGWNDNMASPLLNLSEPRLDLVPAPPALLDVPLDARIVDLPLPLVTGIIAALLVNIHPVNHGHELGPRRVERPAPGVEVGLDGTDFLGNCDDPVDVVSDIGLTPPERTSAQREEGDCVRDAPLVSASSKGKVSRAAAHRTA